jgi:hypothetical protein
MPRLIACSKMAEQEINEHCITKILSNLSGTQVEAVLATLRDIGVSSCDDLPHVREDDLISVLRPIQIRKLLASWMQSGECLLNAIH